MAWSWSNDFMRGYSARGSIYNGISEREGILPIAPTYAAAANRLLGAGVLATNQMLEGGTKTSWRKAIENMVGDFADTYQASGGTFDTYLLTNSNIPALTTTTVLDSNHANLPSDWFNPSPTVPLQALMYSSDYGWESFTKVLNELVWIVDSHSTWDSSAGDQYGWDSSPRSGDLATEKAECAASTPTTAGSGGKPYAWNLIDINAGYLCTAGAQTGRIEDFTIRNVDDLSFTADMYSSSIQYQNLSSPNEYDTQNSSFPVEGKKQRFDTKAFANGTTCNTNVIGSLAFPPNWNSGDDDQSGWEAYQSGYFVLKFDTGSNPVTTY